MQVEDGTAGAAARPQWDQLTRFPSSGAVDTAVPETLTINTRRSDRSLLAVSPSHLAGSSPPSPSSDTMEPDDVTTTSPMVSSEQALSRARNYHSA